MITPETRIIPFCCGEQYSDWVERNCENCTKCHLFNPHAECEIDLALLEAYISDGCISIEIAKRMGYAKESGFEDNYVWDCPERKSV